MGKTLDSKNFYYDVMELVTKYRDAGILDDELLDEIEEIQIEIKNADYDPFTLDDDEMFADEYSLEDIEDN